MWGALQSLYTLMYNAVYPETPDNAFYGYRWQPGQGVPAQLDIIDLENDNLQAGVYVGFQSDRLDTSVDFFGRAGAPPPGPVFVAPPAPSAALTSLITRVRNNPPQNPQEAANWINLAPPRSTDIDGFLTYVATCLEIIHATAAGAQLFNTISGGQFPVFISPAIGGNQTQAANNNNAISLLTGAISDYANQVGFRKQQIRTMIEQRYAAVQGTLAKYNQLASDMNAMPLYSLFLQNFPANFLRSFFRFNGRRFTGQDLFNWLSDGGYSAFNRNVLTFARVQQGVEVKQYFLLALLIALNSQSPPGSGVGSGIKFNVRNEDDNQIGNPSFRPPAIGLAHELMHAMHYSQGTAPGFDVFHFTTTAAELMFAGLGPFAAEPVTENAVRGQWGTIPGALIDPSNTWAAPALRMIYEAPVPPQTAASLRQGMHCI